MKKNPKEKKTYNEDKIKYIKDLLNIHDGKISIRKNLNSKISIRKSQFEKSQFEKSHFEKISIQKNLNSKSLNSKNLISKKFLLLFEN